MSKSQGNMAQTIKTLSKSLKNFPSADPEADNKQEFSTILECLLENRHIINFDTNSDRTRQVKLAKFFKGFIQSFISNCFDVLKTAEDFSLRIDSGDFAFKLIEFVTLKILKKPFLFDFFEMFPQTKSELEKLVLFNISNQDCFFNGNEFVNLNMMKLVLFVLQSPTDSESLQEQLTPLCPKIIEILGVCSFDCSNFDQSLTDSVSEGNPPFFNPQITSL